MAHIDKLKEEIGWLKIIKFRCQNNPLGECNGIHALWHEM